MKTRYLLLLAVLMFTLAGCGEKAASPTEVEDPVLLAREIPAAVQSLIDKYAINSVGSGNVALSDVVTPGGADSLYNFYALTFLWGSLLNVTAPSSGLPLTNWSGTFTVNSDGRIVQIKPINFEAGQDSLLPIPNLNVADWISWAGADFDGISFIIKVRKNTPSVTPVAATFSTAPFFLQLSSVQLAWYSAYYQISNTSGIAIHSQKISPPNACPAGLIAGHWLKADLSGDSGTFTGSWMDQNGTATGVFAGIFWTDTDGKRLFSGHVSGGMTNQIIAYLHGTWYYDDPGMCPLCGARHGRFSGFFQHANAAKDVGVVKGEFGSMVLPPEQLDLPLSGTWSIIRDWFAPTASLNDF